MIRKISVCNGISSNFGMKRESSVGVSVEYKIALFLQWKIAKKYIILNF
jgi:hypothetical protein